ncbi:hypothetical protein OUZ56_006348 [Daphnia magna]|uniref:Uncharacterized protein n=1 Tax=Daphnia magna TaxID=35525 RepID=A0ABQ9YVJ2_9CRUS|nr:hypothetical protein OUZ56_006348 [Daphnia magna]
MIYNPAVHFLVVNSSQRSQTPSDTKQQNKPDADGRGCVKDDVSVCVRCCRGLSITVNGGVFNLEERIKNPVNAN